MSRLTKKYLATRSSNIHTDDSFAKAFFELALRSAEAQIGESETESVKLKDVEIEVRPYEFREQDLVCVEVCVTILGQKICKHVGV